MHLCLFRVRWCTGITIVFVRCIRFELRTQSQYYVKNFTENLQKENYDQIKFIDNTTYLLHDECL